MGLKVAGTFAPASDPLTRVLLPRFAVARTVCHPEGRRPVASHPFASHGAAPKGIPRRSAPRDDSTAHAARLPLRPALSPGRASPQRAGAEGRRRRRLRGQRQRGAGRRGDEEGAARGCRGGHDAAPGARASCRSWSRAAATGRARRRAARRCSKSPRPSRRASRTRAREWCTWSWTDIPALRDTQPANPLLPGGREAELSLSPETSSRAAEKAGLPARVGVAASKLAARVAAGLPDTPTVVPDGEEQRFLAPLPLERLAPALEIAATLDRWGLHSIGELAKLPEGEVASRLGESGRALHATARGIDPRPLEPRVPPPSLHGGHGARVAARLARAVPLRRRTPRSSASSRRLESQALACTRLDVRARARPRRPRRARDRAARADARRQDAPHARPPRARGAPARRRRSRASPSPRTPTRRAARSSRSSVRRRSRPTASRRRSRASRRFSAPTASARRARSTATAPSASR